MFEPDGRNDIQYIGHLLLSAWRIYCMILGFIIVLPWIWIYWNRLTIKAQQGDLRIWERMPRVAVRIDYNSPGLTAGQIEDEAAWTNKTSAKGAENTPGVDPGTWTFPAGLTTLVGPEHGGNYFWYNLPVAAGVITDLDRDHSAMCNLTQGWAGQPRHGDPWWVLGVWNVAPGRNWDTGSGELLLQAKSTSNYHAYVVATDVIARMRVWAAARHFGQDLSDRLAGPDGYWLIPAVAGVCIAAPDVPCGELVVKAPELMPKYQEFARVFNGVFTGHLPVVVVQFQSLLTEDIPKGWVPDWAGDFVGLYCRSSPGLFMTGLSLGAAYDPRRGRPEWFWSDYLWNSTPTSSRDAAEAQGALLAVRKLAFWLPLLKAEGLGDAASVAQVRKILDYLDRAHRESVRTARLDAHHFYNFNGNTLNPLKTGMDEWSPKGW